MQETWERTTQKKKRSASLVKEMVNDKIELNFHVVS